MTGIPLTIVEAADALRSGKLSSVALTKEMLARADYLDPLIGTYITRMDVPALAAAQQADDDFANGVDKGPLQGIPLGIKDIIATKDAPTTAQSQVLDPWWGNGYDAPVTARLREAGAVIIGKTTTMEFACGAPDPEKPFPVPKNPWNVAHWPGGSSSGTGNGVIAGLFLGGLGTDTGGSIRMPAAYCGITGMKQTFGRVPKSGCVPAAWSLDHIGPMARSARDCAIMLQVLAGHDSSDLCSVDEPVPDYLTPLTGSLEGMRIGVERQHHLTDPRQEPEVNAAFEAAVLVLREAGATVFEVVIPEFDYISKGMMSSRAEGFAYHKLDLQDRRQLYGVHTADWLVAGSIPTGWEYVQGQRIRAYGQKVVGEFFKDLDALVTPTVGTGAIELEGFHAHSLFDRPSYTRFWNILGYPAMAIPMGFNNAGLPLSLQVITKPFDEVTNFRVGDAYQQLTDWHLKVPAMAQAVFA